MSPQGAEISRLGVFGGTFDPIHTGHLIAASCAHDSARLDRVLFVPAGDPWQKSGQTVTEVRHRVEMVQLAIAADSRFQLCTVEADRAGPSYMVDTLTELARTHPHAELVLIIGADAFANLGTWHRAAQLSQLAQLAVVTRAGEAEPRLPAQHLLVEMPAVHLSSTQCRVRVAHGQPVEYMVPLEVAQYISQHQLYRNGGRA